jgi:hypothetical protein
VRRFIVLADLGHERLSLLSVEADDGPAACAAASVAEPWIPEGTGMTAYDMGNRYDCIMLAGILLERLQQHGPYRLVPERWM